MTRDKDYVLPTGMNDLQRMTILGEIYMPYCADFLLKNGLRQGLSIADIGCGPGNTALWLAQQTGTNGSVMAIDNSAAQLEILEKRIKDNSLGNIKTLNHDIYKIEELKERFDLIFCRFLLMHLREPLKIIASLQTLLKPGGHLVLAELDNATWYSFPPHPALQEDTRLLCETGHQKGYNFCIGPGLYGYLRQSRFQDVKVQIQQPVLTKKHRQYIVMKSIAWNTIYNDLQLPLQLPADDRIRQLQALEKNTDYLLAGAKMFLVAGKKL